MPSTFVWNYIIYKVCPPPTAGQLTCVLSTRHRTMAIRLLRRVRCPILIWLCVCVVVGLKLKFQIDALETKNVDFWISLLGLALRLSSSLLLVCCCLIFGVASARKKERGTRVNNAIDLHTNIFRGQ